MSRGFVTIATGAERYFEIAENLLRSYHKFASVKYPFAIICDRKNNYTSEFDDVILLEKPNCNYLDKLQLYKYLPYDETIFIDADSLAYGDLDEWWNIFKNADDFSVFGYAWTDLNCGRGWFVPEGIGEYKDKVTFIPDFNGGVYYLRRSETCRKIFELANYFAENFENYMFNGFTSPADEPCLALAMAVNQCMPLDIHEKGIVFAPGRKNIELNIDIPKAVYHSPSQGTYCVNLIHWSNYRTKLALYKFEVKKLKKLQEQCTGISYKLLYQCKVLYYIYCLANITVYVQRAVEKIKKMLKKQMTYL